MLSPPPVLRYLFNAMIHTARSSGMGTHGAPPPPGAGWRGTAVLALGSDQRLQLTVARSFDCLAE